MFAENFLMINIKEKSKCTGCGACKCSCPQMCIAMVEDSEGFLYPKVDEKLCVHCGKCDGVCPVLNNSPNNTADKAYSARALEKDVQLKSSSGGVFYYLAVNCIKIGSVFAAAFDDEFVLRHSEVPNTEELEKYLGSKYVQSDLGDTFILIKEKLENNELVLFAGTPCQIAGLKNYLGREYDKLITVDFICHGVPSPLVFRKYINYICEGNPKKIESILFRDKTDGWENFSFRINFRDGNPIITNKNEDLYMRAFFDNVFLRPSCYDCNFKTVKKYSDITLGDFWGVKKYNELLYDKDGVSIVLINSKNGQSAFDSYCENMHCSNINTDDVKRLNSAFLESAKPSNTRKMFFKRINKMSIEKNLKQAINPNISSRIKLKVIYK